MSTHFALLSSIYFLQSQWAFLKQQHLRLRPGSHSILIVLFAFVIERNLFSDFVDIFFPQYWVQKAKLLISDLLFAATVELSQPMQPAVSKTLNSVRLLIPVTLNTTGNYSFRERPCPSNPC